MVLLLPLLAFKNINAQKAGNGGGVGWWLPGAREEGRGNGELVVFNRFRV